MRSRLRVLLAAGACLAVVGGMATFASANTELVPGSRLVVPYYSNANGDATFLYFTNASTPGSALCPGGGCFAGLHVEFYAKTCIRQNTQVVLSPGDIDEMAVAPNVPATPEFAQGWVDIDVRAFGAIPIPPGFPLATSYQHNSVMGTVLITNVAGDYAFAYPMASYQGTSIAGPGGAIVTHDGQGRATAWTGHYEPAPWNVYVPVFLAEGGPLGNAAWLALAGPADGNWDFSGSGESPGQEIGKAPAASLLTLSALVWDGCEQNRSRNFDGHYIITKFDNLLTLNTPKQPWNTAAFPNPCGAFPSVDVDGAGTAIGWVDIVNTRVSCDNAVPGALPSQCIAYAPGATVVIPKFAGNGVGQRRGMVGVMLENTTAVVKQGEVVRLWGNPRPWGLQCNAAPGFPQAAIGIGAGCWYNRTDLTTHPELALP